MGPAPLSSPITRTDQHHRAGGTTPGGRLPLRRGRWGGCVGVCVRAGAGSTRRCPCGPGAGLGGAPLGSAPPSLAAPAALGRGAGREGALPRRAAAAGARPCAERVSAAGSPARHREPASAFPFLFIYIFFCCYYYFYYQSVYFCIDALRAGDFGRRGPHLSDPARFPRLKVSGRAPPRPYRPPPGSFSPSFPTPGVLRGAFPLFSPPSPRTFLPVHPKLPVGSGAIAAPGGTGPRGTAARRRAGRGLQPRLRELGLGGDLGWGGRQSK